MASILSEFAKTKREFLELEQLFKPENKDSRKIVFYVESPIQFRYYQDYFEYILGNSQLDICYLSSDENDPIFHQGNLKDNPRIKPFYLKNLLNTAFSRLDAKVLIIANPDLNKGSIKRAPDSVHHIYAFRGIASLHQGYRLGAFDHFDSLLCIGEYQVAEARATEKLYKQKAKELPVVGYPLTERLYREHQEFLKDNQSQAQAKPICLVAPTWDPFNKASIMDCCIEELVDELAKTEFETWLRPHPEFAKRFPKRMQALQHKLTSLPNVTIQDKLASMECLHRASMLITDHSSISMDYVLATERPCVFINTPGRIDNKEWPKLGLEPVENQYRQKLGASIDLDKLNEVPAVISKLQTGKEEFKGSVAAMRDVLLANWQKAGAIGGQYILDKALS
jgi:YidC/Oxa1 family membrane protein insertase